MFKYNNYLNLIGKTNKDINNKNKKHPIKLKRSASKLDK